MFFQVLTFQVLFAVVAVAVEGYGCCLSEQRYSNQGNSACNLEYNVLVLKPLGKLRYFSPWCYLYGQTFQKHPASRYIYWTDDVVPCKNSKAKFLRCMSN